MHPNNGRVDHLYRRVMGASQRVHDVSPNARPPPANEAIVAGSVGTKTVGQVAPGCTGPQNPKDAIEDAAVVHPCYAARLVRQHRLDGSPFVVGKFIAHDFEAPQLGTLNYERAARLNTPFACRSQR